MASVSEKPHMEGWELAALFLVFLIITLVWDLLVGALTFLNNILRGRKANWLARVKEELLALGVVSLVLLFVQPSLQTICIRMPGSSASPTADAASPPPVAVAYGTVVCAAGTRQVFPYTVVSAAHYLLFYLAIVHILFSLLTSVITNVKLAKWSVLERTARKEQNIPAVAFLRISSVVTRAVDPAHSSIKLRLHDAWRDVIGFVDQDLYALLRFMCEKRFRAHSVYLRNYNFLNMCEQCLEAELNEVYSHAWLLVLMMALLLLYNRAAYQIVWITGCCICAMALMAGNMRWVMKKTAREARNLWRRVQGVGGLERDEGEPEEEPPLSQPQLPELGLEGPLHGGGGEHEPHGHHPGQHHPHAGHWHGATGRGSARYGTDATAEALMAAARASELKAGKAAAGSGGGGGGGGARGGGDVEAGDVGGEVRHDQLRQMHGTDAHRAGARPTTSLNAASRPHAAAAGRPLGEAAEAPAGSWGAAADPAAVAAAGRAPAPPALTWRPGSSGTEGEPPRCRSGAAGAGAGRELRRPGGAWRVSPAPSCSPTQPGPLALQPQPQSRGPGPGGEGPGGSGPWLESAGRGPAAAAVAAAGRRTELSAQGAPSVSSATSAAGPGRSAGALVELVEAGRAARAAVAGRWRSCAASRSARRVEPAAWFRRLPRPELSGVAAGCGGGGGGGGGDGGGGGSGGWCPGGEGIRWRRQGPGPVAEATVSNPLYASAAAGGGGGVNGAPAYGGQVGSPYMYGVVGNGNGTLHPGGMNGGMYGVTGGSSGFGGQIYGGGGMPSLLGGAPSAPYGVPAGGLIAAAAAAPYGGMNGGLLLGGGASSTAAAAATAAVAGQPTPPPDANGQWGSNPSSGDNPEEGDGERRSGSSSSSASGSSSSSGSGSGSSGSGSIGPKSKSGSGSSADHDVHSEKSMLEHELAYGIEEKITRLFFFGRPFLLLWVFNIIFAQASLTMTMSMAFVIPYDKFDSIRDVAQDMAIWLPVVLTNLMLVFYGCWVFLPQYALLSVCGILEPHEVMEEIKRSKTQDDSEEGVAAVVLDKLTAYFIGKHDGETRLSTAFIVCLASQAGIILGRDYKAARHINRRDLKPMYRELVMVWHDIAWYGELSSTYHLKTNGPSFRAAFDELDEDGSGQLSFGELANMIRSLGTYATAGDVEAMLWEIDIDQSHSIGFDEFVKFLTYAFFDTSQAGYIDMRALMDGMDRLGMPINDMQATVLMSVGEAEQSGELRISLRQFFELYAKVAFEEDGDDEDGSGGSDGGGGGGSASRPGSVLGRALGVLRAPSRYLISRLSSSRTAAASGNSAHAVRHQASGTSLSASASASASAVATRESGAPSRADSAALGTGVAADGGGGGGGGGWQEQGGLGAAATAGAGAGAGQGGGRPKQPSRLAVVSMP